MADKEVNTGGGTFVREDVNIDSGDFVGRDKTNTTHNIENTTTTSSTYLSGNFIVTIMAVLVVGIIATVSLLQDGLTGIQGSPSSVITPTVLTVIDEYTKPQPNETDQPKLYEFKGIWQRQGYKLQFNVTGTHIFGETFDPIDGTTNVISGTFNKKNYNMALVTVKRTLPKGDAKYPDGCTHIVYVTFTLLNDSEMEQMTTGSDGNCGVPIDFTDGPIKWNRIANSDSQ